MAAATPQKIGEGKTILVIEDDPSVQMLVRKALGMFAEPYERDNAKRRTKYFAPGTRSWDEQLEAFTYEIEAIRGEPYFGEAVLEFARSRDLIPR